MPSEWPRQTVTAVVARNSANAPQVKCMGPPISAASVIPVIHSDLAGFQRTTPRSASVSSASNMRGERNVLCDATSAASTQSAAARAGNVATGAMITSAR